MEISAGDRSPGVGAHRGELADEPDGGAEPPLALLEPGLETPVEVLAATVGFHLLAGHGTDTRIVEVPHQHRDGTGGKVVVGIGEDDDGRGDLGEPEVDGLRLAEPVVGGNDDGAGVLGARRGLDVGIGHHHDVERAGVAVGEDVAHLGPDRFGFGVGGDEHGDGGPLLRIRHSRRCVAPGRRRQPRRVQHVSGRGGRNEGADSQTGSSDHA